MGFDRISCLIPTRHEAPGAGLSISRAGDFPAKVPLAWRYFPIGKFSLDPSRKIPIFPDREIAMSQAVSDPPTLGRVVRETRRALALTQPGLALSAGVGVRFLVDIEKGKPTAQIGKIMQVLAALGIEMQLSPPDPIKATDG
jgi:HTH-type transcriptional regulator/antitoxin HipB